MLNTLRKNKTFQYYLYKNTKSRAFFKLYGIVWKEWRVCFSQFFSLRHPFSGTYRCLKYFSQSLLRLVLGRSISLSYSFTVEDRIIESLIKPIITRNGFYVDVGCNEPEFISNSFLFYRRGWRGLCIDGNEKLIRKHKRVRPRDKTVCAVVSDKNEKLEFTIAENPVLSSADYTSIEEFQKEGIGSVQKIQVEAKNLTTIFNENQVPQEFDFLSIDIEGNDLKALYGLDLTKYRPKLIVFEWESFNIASAKDEEVVRYLEKFGYRYVGYLLTNVYFMKK